MTPALAPEWHIRGICHGHPKPDLWHPSGTGGEAARDTAEAKEICGHCPVQQTCWQWALETRQPYGVWGGMDAAQRATRLGRRAPDDPDAPEPTPRQVQPCGTVAAYERHRKRHEKPCDPCREAQAHRSKEQREQKKQPAVCGEESGVLAHRRRKEALCDACRQARESMPERRGGGKQKPIAHGTYNGARQHRYRGEKPCAECRDAERASNRVYQEERRAREKAGAA